jgi:pimeloyl-ACP methyl ester carboxylesterase
VIDGKTTARLESLERVGHFPEREASDKVNALIRDFFLQ